MTGNVVHLLLLWLAVFVGLDVAFGDGALTDDLGEALERVVRRVRELLQNH